MRFFAVETILNNIDGAIATDTGEDYYLYRRPSTGLWVLMPWDQNENFQDATAGILRMGIAQVRRVVLVPDFLRLYYKYILQYLDGPFDPRVMASRLNSVRFAFDATQLDAISQFVATRQVTVRDLLPTRLGVGVEPRYFARTGDEWRFFRGTREPTGGTTQWAGVSFVDTSWEQGPGGFGYGDGDDRTTLTDMEGNYTSIYARHAFDLANPASVTTLTLSLRVDDGCVLYLNGTEVARRNVTGTVHFDTEADGDHEVGAPTIIDLTGSRNLLRAGKNVFAAVGFNNSPTSSDLTLDPQLYGSQEGSGCGTRLFASSGTIALGGRAPILDTVAVEVNGSPAIYDALAGQWYSDVPVGAGSNAIEIAALDSHGARIEAIQVEVVNDATPSTVSGNLATTRWTAAAGPYHVTGDLTVPLGATLTIDPGVGIYVDSGVSIVIRGTLLASGTQGQPIHFEGASCAAPWGGIAFVGATARGTLLGVEIEGASTPDAGATAYPAAVSVAAGAQVHMETSRIANSVGLAVDASDGSQLVLLDSVVESAASGIRAVSSHVEVERVSVRNMDRAGAGAGAFSMRLEEASSPPSVVRDCRLENGAQNGLELARSNALLEGNTVQDFGCQGISIEGTGSPSLLGNLVIQCAEGMGFKDGATPVLRHATVNGCGLGLHFYEKTGGEGGVHVVADSLIVWGNGASLLLDASSSLDASFSDVEAGFPGAGNGDFNPLFVSPVTGDYHLRAGSPALGTGKNGEDMGAFSTGVTIPGQFIRGDANDDGSVDISDPIKILFYLFAAVSSPTCLDSLDADDRGSIDITDAIFLLQFLFNAGTAPPPPFPGAGVDPTTGDPYHCE